MADVSTTPPLLEEPLGQQDGDDLFVSTVDTLDKSQTIPPEQTNGDKPSPDAGLQETTSPQVAASSENANEPSDTKHANSTTNDPKGIDSANARLQITVTEPKKMGEGMGAFVVYHVITHTNLPFFKKKSYEVPRRFSDFLGLHEKLVAKHLHMGRVIPPAPEKSILGATKIKMAKDEAGVVGDEFVERRRAQLERFLHRVVAHPTLMVDPDVREFLEMEEELPKSTQTSALSGAGVMRAFNKVGDMVTRMTYKMEEQDQWFEERQQHVENLYTQMRKLHVAIDETVEQRRELASGTGVVAKSIAMVGNCDAHTGLSRVLAKLSDVEERIEHLHSKQAHHDLYCVAEIVKDYLGLLSAVKESFRRRVEVHQTWQHAQHMLTRKREQLAKLQLATRSDKIPQAKAEVEEWEAKVDRCEEEFNNVSKIVRKEVEAFEEQRVQELKGALIKYLELLLDTQQQLISYWESFLPEAKNFEAVV